MKKPDLYSVLAVDRTADAAAIRTAYRTVAKTLHPDHGGAPEAFRLLKLALDVLSDPSQRAQYDETGVYVETQSASVEAQRRRQALGDLFAFVMLAVSNPLEQDVIALMRVAAGDRIRFLSDQFVSLRDLIEKIDLVAGKICSVTDENILKDIAEARRDDLYEKIETTIIERQMYSLILDHLAQYSMSYMVDGGGRPV